MNDPNVTSVIVHTLLLAVGKKVGITAVGGTTTLRTVNGMVSETPATSLDRSMAGLRLINGRRLIGRLGYDRFVDTRFLLILAVMFSNEYGYKMILKPSSNDWIL